MNWQPIETAPEHVEILLFAVSVEKKWPQKFCKVGFYNKWSGGFTNDGLGGPRSKITHWMPLPEPPRGHIPPPVDVPYLAVGMVLQPLPHTSISSSDSHTSSDASPEAAPRPTD